MQITPCNSYDARVVDVRILCPPGGRSVFKIYYVSIVGRDDPSRCEWAHCEQTVAQFESRLVNTGLEGVGFVTAFPHITKIFRYAPSVEILQHVTALNTVTFEPIDLARDEGYMEFACYAEAALAADEYHAWAVAETVDEYLAYTSDFKKAPVVSNTKLAEYWAT
ncbi:MAG: hypothetical protein KAI66_15565 [Lentisphaeria bacterium]|nr:hypothetical protein [Lentisphaeria bacterium]